MLYVRHCVFLSSVGDGVMCAQLLSKMDSYIGELGK